VIDLRRSVKGELKGRNAKNADASEIKRLDSEQLAAIMQPNDIWAARHAAVA
jgi:hypothetical protein